ncbi:hypothetical protein O9Z70_03855 [Devosia sp. YIM 151766]|uniref:hypothetical protein n=1 Tax=Devosia sp. YIM 151766 TaxID=3017325 RepID=UPI00255D08F5|nr:hypothetical protein [Devosia sp. YIM 151766]WIY53686.1 hypothetical protein O9Z70_03855 [Devosia sp. YIM 151766]
MSDVPADFAIVGSTPLARLLAGLLCGSHGRTVLFVGESQSSYRLPRGIDLSVAPMTRPESWSLLGGAMAESTKLIGRIAGRGAWRHVDPIFFTDRPRAAEAVSHMRHMALDFGIAVEAVPPALLGETRHGVRFRDALLLNRPLAEPAMDAWLERQGCRRLIPESLVIEADGGSTLSAAGEVFQARQTVLADHDAILAYLPRQQWPALLQRHPAASILTMPARPLAAPVMMEIHSGITLLQQPEGGIAAIGLEDLASFSDRVQGLLGQQGQVEQAGQTGFTTLATDDGAPAVGRVGGSGADIVVGMGATGVFLAPALARWFCGQASTDEAAWFGDRLISRATDSRQIADFTPGIASETA